MSKRRNKRASTIVQAPRIVMNLADPEHADKVRQLRRSNAASPHVSAKHKGTRKSRIAAAIRDFSHR